MGGRKRSLFRDQSKEAWSLDELERQQFEMQDQLNTLREITGKAVDEPADDSHLCEDDSDFSTDHDGDDFADNEDIAIKKNCNDEQLRQNDGDLDSGLRGVSQISAKMAQTPRHTQPLSSENTQKETNPIVERG